MKKARISKKMMALVLTLVTLMACTTSAFALKLTKSDHFTVRDGIFNVETNLYIDGGTQYRGAIFINTADLKNSPSGTMFAKSQVWDTSGRSICESHWDYNYEANYWLGSVTDTGYSSKPVYAGGSVKLGADQRLFTAPNTDSYPNSRAGIGGMASAGGSYSNTDLYLNSQAVTTRLMSTLSSDGDYPRAASGETYGSSMLAGIVGHDPDLIAAKGTNGLYGYVKNEDLNPEFNCEADFNNYIANLKANDWKFPLYDLQGNVIGDFKISENKLKEVAPNATCPADVKKALELEANGRLPDGPTMDEIRDFYEAQGANTVAGDSADRNFANNNFSVIPAETVRENQIKEWLVNGEYRKTADGKTYGPNTLADIVGTLPDLIAVQGMEGHYGYVKIEDYDPFYFCKTTEDVIALFKGAGTLEECIIPVYDLNGKIIDQYKR